MQLPKEVYEIIITSQPEAAVIALGEIQKLDPNARGVKLSAETQLVAIPKGYTKIINNLRQTIFIRHVFPVYDKFSANINNMAQRLAELCADMPAHEAFSIQMRSASRDSARIDAPLLIKETEQSLTSAGFVCDDKAPVWVLSLCITDDEIFAGVSYCKDNLSSWSGGAHRLKKSGQFISRAEFKLQEAISAFEIDIFGNANKTSAVKALDLGAAPGGWTKILLEHGLHVTAVDPAALSEIIIDHPRLLHVRDTAQKFRGEAGAFNFITNDMRMDMTESCKIMLGLAPLLSGGGAVLMTLKLSQGQWFKKTNRALSVLKKKYDVLNVRQLFHNRSEVMVYMKLR